MSKTKTNTTKSKTFNQKDMIDLWMSEKTGQDIKADMADDVESEDNFMTDHLDYIEALTQDQPQLS